MFDRILQTFILIFLQIFTETYLLLQGNVDYFILLANVITIADMIGGIPAPMNAPR